MSELPTPETNAAEYLISIGRTKEEWMVRSDLSRKLERERDEARKHREQLNSLLASHNACWDEIIAALGEREKGDKTCDLDRVLKAIRERDEARQALREIKAADWKTSGELRGMARKALEAVK